MNTLENFCIYKETKANNQINNKGIFRHNIFNPCLWVRHHGTAHPQGGDGGMASNMGGSCE